MLLDCVVGEMFVGVAELIEAKLIAGCPDIALFIPIPF